VGWIYSVKIWSGDTSRNRNRHISNIAFKRILIQLFLKECEQPGPLLALFYEHLNELRGKLHAAADCSASVFGLGLALPMRLEQS